MNYCVVVQSINDGIPFCVRYFSTYEESKYYAGIMESLSWSKAFILHFDSENGCFYQ